MDCSAFLNWSKEQPQSDEEMAVVFRSLVATVKLQPSFDAPLEAKAVRLIQTVEPTTRRSADSFLSKLSSISDESPPIATAAVEMLVNLISNCSAKVRLSLVKADIILHLMTTLNPHSFSYSEPEDIHMNVISCVYWSFWLAAPYDLAELGFEDDNEQQAVHRTVLTQIVAPSEKYLCHLCVNRFSIVDGALCSVFVRLLARLLEICAYYPPTMEFVLHMPVVLTIPSCLTFFETDDSIYYFLLHMIMAQREWNTKTGQKRQMWKAVDRMLRMEGIEDVIEEKLQTDKNEYDGELIVRESIRWNNKLGMNLSYLSLDHRPTLLLLRRHTRSRTARLWKTMRRWMATIGGDEKEQKKEEKVLDSPPAHLSACLRRCKRSSESLFVALADDNATDRSLSPTVRQTNPNGTRWKDEIAAG
ncbi:hypothetical protein BLNAU_11989 [Blattamonas nauphoetae]|uniref:Uncharacterized protein n=1 Tax=Blattamonas nauphoetae TaxID=2049346 RepID=A0ABQ9XNC4_9EUKA|nr:hypothetical protein BLNAU_11989 [Blattamonas nauphoetae]